MQPFDFHSLADQTLDRLTEALEPADEAGLLETEQEAGVLTITTPHGKVWVVSKHEPSRQLWLSSPVSGGLHFSYHEGWALADGRRFMSILTQELHDIAAVELDIA